MFECHWSVNALSVPECLIRCHWNKILRIKTGFMLMSKDKNGREDFQVPNCEAESDS